MGDIVRYQDIQSMAGAMIKSHLFGVQTQDQAVALMLVAQAEGLHPATAARDYHIIQGRPSLKADAMLARFHAAGGKVEWTSYTDHRVSAKFIHPQGGTIEVDWDMARARTAGLGGKDMWKKYPRQMLRSRVISEGIRAVYPGVVCGVYSLEEAMDMEPMTTAPPTERRQVENTAPAPTPYSPPAIDRRQLARTMQDRYWANSDIKQVVQDWLAKLDCGEFEDTTQDQRRAFLADIQAGRYDPPTSTTPPAATPVAATYEDDIGDIGDIVTAMADCDTLDDLARIYKQGYQMAYAAGNQLHIEMLVKCKDARKAEIQQPTTPTTEAA